jgi:uncharacterized protein (TIGR02145 family)
MKNVLFLVAIFCILRANAQTYTISFSGTGLSTVNVQNLASGVVVDVPSGDVLLLSAPTDIPEVNNLISSGLKVYPNPMTEKSALEIIPPVAGDAIISICDMSGRELTQLKVYLENSSHGFSLSGIKSGLYVINVQGNGYQFSEKLISNVKPSGRASITTENNNSQAVAEKKSQRDYKGVPPTVDMAYNAGERLKYTAVSGDNSTVITDIPAEDKTVYFTFTECKDGDNNFYPVVQIGTQLWMGTNLKTTKLNDATEIPLVTGTSAWSSLSTPGYCWFDNDEVTNKSTYGAIYNWHTVNTGKLCPIGWHVPGDAEWTILTTFLGGESVAGGKLKETLFTHWPTPNTGATNETGFTAVPGRFRKWSGEFIHTWYCYWWSTTSLSGSYKWGRQMFNDNSTVYRFYDFPENGLSVRCVKD